MTDVEQTPILFYGPGTCSFGCMVVAEWQNMPYKLCRAEREVRHSEAYKQVNPLNQVPALKTKDGFITQNAAILLHLAAANMKTGLLSRPGTPEFDHINQCLSYLGSTFHIAFHPLFAASRFSKDEAVQKQLKDSALENVRAQYANMELTLKDKEFLVGGKKGVVDAYFYGMARWGAKFFDIKKEYPVVAAFMARMEQDPAVKFALEVEEKGEAVNAKTTGKYQGHVKLEEAKAVTAKAA